MQLLLRKLSYIFTKYCLFWTLFKIFMQNNYNAEICCGSFDFIMKSNMIQIILTVYLQEFNYFFLFIPTYLRKIYRRPDIHLCIYTRTHHQICMSIHHLGGMGKVFEGTGFSLN